MGLGNGMEPLPPALDGAIPPDEVSRLAIEEEGSDSEDYLDSFEKEPMAALDPPKEGPTGAEIGGQAWGCAAPEPSGGT